MALARAKERGVRRRGHAPLLALPQTFDMVFRQYLAHPEAKSLALDGGPCKADSQGLLRRFTVNSLWCKSGYLKEKIV